MLADKEQEGRLGDYTKTAHQATNHHYEAGRNESSDGGSPQGAALADILRRAKDPAAERDFADRLGDVACWARDCLYCDCGRSRWYVQEQSEDGHPLAVLLNTRPDEKGPLPS